VATSAALVVERSGGRRLDYWRSGFADARDASVGRLNAGGTGRGLPACAPAFGGCGFTTRGVLG
jgi:hypothetical protein